MTADNGPLPRIHPRHAIMARARNELFGLLIEWRKFNGLTVAEELSLLADYMQMTLSGAIEEEREGNDRHQDLPGLP